jgi:hypothetical protein
VSEGPEQRDARAAHQRRRAGQEPVPARTWAFAGFALAVGLFFGVRTAIFLACLALLARQPHPRRLFQYHGAEHNAIAALTAATGGLR